LPALGRDQQADRGEREPGVLVELGVVEQRYRAVLEVLEDGASVTDVARRYGVARQTVHEWLGAALRKAAWRGWRTGRRGRRRARIRCPQPSRRGS
jgi:DNA-binding NarL/FixJ family response regulator